MVRQLPHLAPGEVVEWLMAPVLKTGVPKGTVGSNPTLSASEEFSKGLVRPDPLLYLGSWRVGGPGGSAQNQYCPHNVWVEVWVEIGVVWVDKMCVGGILKCPSLTRKSVPLRQQSRGRRKVVGTLCSWWWNLSAREEASPLWEGFGSLLDGRVLWWMFGSVSMEKELGSGL